MKQCMQLSVYIVSYNQEAYIAEAIESVVTQSVLPYELCIFDDHSTDGTWQIIQQYQEKYPDLIKAYRHTVNQGIFRNFNYAESHLNGNLITCVAGDDYIMPGYFEDVQECIVKNQLNPDEDSFIIIPNVINIDANNYKQYHSNVSLQNEKKLLSLRIRGMIDDRYGIVSRASFEKIATYIENIGIHADFVWGVDRYINTDRFFFIEGFYSVYRQSVGIVSRTKEIDAAKSLIKAIEIIKERFVNDLCQSDLRYLNYIQAKNKYLSQKSFRTYFLLFALTFLNMGNYGSFTKFVKAFVFIFLPASIKAIIFKSSFFKRLSNKL